MNWRGTLVIRRRWAQETAAEVVVFLAPAASSFMTGSELFFDGGAEQL
jgi:NAD(P)-dependent dehydrogenase (short-subunit alcohol dehydrogenase family)